MKPSALILFILMLAVTSCGTRATPPPTSTVGVTQVPFIPTFTPIPRPQAVLSQVATLYSGPGNGTYPSMVSLLPGTKVNLL